MWVVVGVWRVRGSEWGGQKRLCWKCEVFVGQGYGRLRGLREALLGPGETLCQEHV